MTVSKQFSDVIDPTRATALMATLGNAHSFQTGDPIPTFGHYLYFWDIVTPDRLGRDSHPKLGEFMPDLGLPRRMWAGGHMSFDHPLLAGKPAAKTSTISRAEKKEGRSGPLAIVAVDHVVEQDGKVCVRERQDIVYLPDRDPKEPQRDPPVANGNAQHTRTVSFDTTSLFRYSALTFNGHRIHYDLDYSTSVEGYSGLVVHGPLLAQMVMLFWEEINGRVLQEFSFRMTAPLMHFETATLCVNEENVWVEGPDRRQCLVGTAG